MSSLEEKNKEMFPLLSLPDDLVLTCVARVSRLYYPTLSLVSKRFRSLLASPELYETRSVLGRTESCLYVCIWLSGGGCDWFTLCRKPDQNLTSDTEKSSGYVLARTSIPCSPPVNSWGIVAVGHNIYNVSSSIYKTASVSILDCRSHTWLEAPRLGKRLRALTASLVDQKIYLAGWFYEDVNPFDRKKNLDLVEVFDTKTRIWDPVPVPSEIHDCFLFGSTCIDGRFHLRASDEVLAYNSKEGRWDQVEGSMSRCMLADSHCVIENVLYCGFMGTFTWYDTEARKVRELKGLVGLPKITWGARVKLANYGGKMAVLWENNLPNKTMIWCAEISLEKHNSCEIWGKVEWFDHVLTIDLKPVYSPRIVSALAVTV